MITRLFTRSGKRRKRPKSRYRTTNWSEYEKGLETRGDCTLWIPAKLENLWYEEQSCVMDKGRPLYYSNLAIELMFVFRVLERMPQRQAVGRVRAIFKLMGLGNLKLPSRRTINRRIALLDLDVKTYVNKVEKLRAKGESIVIALDSTGLKIFGEYEWCNHKHGGRIRKAWRKLHISVCDNQILSFRVTTNKVDDRAVMSELIKESGDIDTVVADGGYHTNTICDELKERGIVAVIPPPSDGIVQSKDNTTINDANINYIKEKGINAWKVKHKHGRKEQAENTFSRIKRHNKGRMLHKNEALQLQEGAVLCSIMNKFQSIAWPQTEKIC